SATAASGPITYLVMQDQLPLLRHAGSPAIRALCASPGALPGAQDLLPEDVRVAAMLGEFPQAVQIHPPQGQRSQIVPPENVVQAEPGAGPAGGLARLGVCAADGLDGVVIVEDE